MMTDTNGNKQAGTFENNVFVKPLSLEDLKQFP